MSTSPQLVYPCGVTQTGPYPMTQNRILRMAGVPGDPFAVDIALLTGKSPFSDWFAAAMTKKRETQPSWDINSLGIWRSTSKLFIESHGDRPIQSYTLPKLREFRSLLCALPKNHHKSADSPGLYEIIEQSEIEHAQALALAENEIEFCELNRGDAEAMCSRVPCVRVNTVYRHCQAIKFIFQHAADHHAVAHNLMKPIMWTKRQLSGLYREEAKSNRLAWGDKIMDLLPTSAFTQSGQAGDTVHAVFLPTLLAARAGLREEALQLKICDVGTIDGVPVMRIQSGEGQHIKSDAPRIVPIHDNLIALGLLAFVEARRCRGQHWLFPEIERCVAKGRLSGTFTKTFWYYRVKEGVYDSRRDFHSLRTHFNVARKRRKCPLEIRKRMMGHTTQDVTEDHYDTEGSPIEEFRDWVNRIEIDISGIKSP